MFNTKDFQMKNEEKILELLAESLRKTDLNSEKIDRNNEKIDRNSEQIQKLVKVQITQTEIMRGMAMDIKDLKSRNNSIEELEKRMDELERYTGKK